MSKVQFTEAGMPFAVPEVKLSRGEVTVVEIPTRDGEKSPFSIVGFPDRDGRIIYLPVKGGIYDETGEIDKTMQQLGVEKVVDTWKMSEELAARIIESSERMPLVLAVDRELNHVEKDDIGDYPLPIDGVPVEMVGVAAKPQTGKTRMLLELKREAMVNGTTSNLMIVDLDDMSPESYTRLSAWVDVEIAEGRIDPRNEIEYFDKINDRVVELSRGERGVREKPNLRDQLAQIRKIYQKKGEDYVECRGFNGEPESLYRKKMVLVDLPGVSYEGKVVTEKRPRDVFDCLFRAMPTVELFKASEHLPVWGLVMERTLFDKDASPRVYDWELNKEILKASLGIRPVVSSALEMKMLVKSMNFRTGTQTLKDLIGEMAPVPW